MVKRYAAMSKRSSNLFPLRTGVLSQRFMDRICTVIRQYTTLPCGCNPIHTTHGFNILWTSACMGKRSLKCSLQISGNKPYSHGFLFLFLQPNFILKTHFKQRAAAQTSISNLSLHGSVALGSWPCERKQPILYILQDLTELYITNLQQLTTYNFPENKQMNWTWSTCISKNHPKTVWTSTSTPPHAAPRRSHLAHWCHCRLPWLEVFYLKVTNSPRGWLVTKHGWVFVNLFCSTSLAELFKIVQPSLANDLLTNLANSAMEALCPRWCSMDFCAP